MKCFHLRQKEKFLKKFLTISEKISEKGLKLEEIKLCGR